MIQSKIVFTNGCFDILHIGHVKLLNYCATLGKVIVGLNSDSSVTHLKGHGRPVNSEEDRKLMLLNLRSVSQVIVFNEATPLNLIRDLQPDFIVKGGDYNVNEVVGSDLAEVRIFKFIDGYSSTSIMKRIHRISENSTDG
jgi:D-beta-D-heptose 7-phosphate kinase/D-beta-D-heptose 1-phosphate adenosyltransferase